MPATAPARAPGYAPERNFLRDNKRRLGCAIRERFDDRTRNCEGRIARYEKRPTASRAIKDWTCSTSSRSFSNGEHSPFSRDLQKFLVALPRKGRKSTVGNLPGELTCRFPALMICRVHRPSAFSPQKCTLRKGQSSKLELRTSRGRSNNKVEVVPIGEVNRSRKFPRGKNLKETCFTMRISPI